MDAAEKIPLKRAEVSVRKFNEEAIPHHLGLLKNHKSNIEKSLALNDWNKIKREELNAMRIIKQIKNILLEMEALRGKIREEDLDKFDDLIAIGKNKALEGMREFLELQLKSPASNMEPNDDENNEHLHSPVEFGSAVAQSDYLPRIRTNFRTEEHQLAERQACLNEMENLQSDIQDLNGIFHNVRGLVHEQTASVQAIADNADEALEQVQIGESNLRRALSYKKAMYPMFGALIGTCIGGPIGMVVGMKAAGLAAVSCGLLGFTGGTVLKTNDEMLMQQGSIEEGQHELDRKKQ